MSVVLEEMSDLAVSKNEATNRLAQELKDSGVLADLFARIDAGDVDLSGDGGLIPALVKTTLERGLTAEMDSHLGYSHFDLGCDDVLGHSLGGVSENECYV